jgi:hypothetical protein
LVLGFWQWLEEGSSWPFFYAGAMLFYDQYLSQKDITLFYQERSI